MNHWRGILLLVGLSSLASLRAASSDEYKLRDSIRLRGGGMLHGTIVEQDVDVGGRTQNQYVVTLDDGTVIRLAATAVEGSVQRPSPAHMEYAEKRRGLADTVDAHWELQAWCKENRLDDERDYHLQRIIELDPEHTDARLLLDYMHHQGQWVLKEHFFRGQGYVKDHRGHWRLPQGIEFARLKEDEKDAAVKWKRDLKLWRRALTRGNDPAALQNIRQATDPAAMDGLVELLEEETDPGLRAEFLDTIARMKTAAAHRFLIRVALEHEDERLREKAIVFLKQPEFDAAITIRSLRPLMNPTPATPNDHVNRAGYLAGQLGDSSAVRMLIDGLITTHTVRNPNYQPGNARAGMDKSGGSGLQWGSKEKPTIDVAVTNRAVLDALRIVTRQNFDYDEARWLQWFIDTQSVKSIDLRRDK
jgi:hypothetical protein